MNMCRHHGIHLWNIKRKEDIVFEISAADYKKLPPMAAKTNIYPKICCRHGLPFQITWMKRNWTFVTGILLFFCTLAFLSSFVWEITYRGQSSYSKETLQRTVEGLSVYTGMKRSRLDCDYIEKEIRRLHPQISWVSAEEKGSVLQISIKEGKKTIEHEKNGQSYHLISPYSGVVQSIAVNRGTALVKKGDKVKKGQILISGVVPVTGDSDEIVKKNAVAAKGNIEILVEENVAEEVSLQYQKKIYTGKEIQYYEIQTGTKRFYIRNPLKRLDNSAKYDIITTVCTNRTIHPYESRFKITQINYREYQLKNCTYSREELKKEGLKQYQHRLREIKDAGMALISHSAVMTQKDAKTWLVKGKISYVCDKMDTKTVTKEELICESMSEENEDSQ